MELREQFLDYLKKSWPELVDFEEESNQSKIYASFFGYPSLILRNTEVKFPDTKKVFQYKGEFKELKEYTDWWVKNHISSRILELSRKLVEPLKEYLEKHEDINYRKLWIEYKIDEPWISIAFYCWDAAVVFKVKVTIENLEDIERLDTLQSQLKEIQRRDEDFKKFKIEEIEYTI